MYNPATMQPLMDAGWKFNQIGGPAAGCSDCNSSFTNIDYVASLRGGAYNNSSSNGISYEFSWKPEIFTTKADVMGFQMRYCKQRYDVVHIGKGLHDAAFKQLDDLTPERLRERFLKLADLVQCFPPTTLVVLRTPYLSTKRNRNGNCNEEDLIVNMTEVLEELVSQGAFGARRSVLIDGHLLTTKPSHPFPFDGHHYATSVSQMYWFMVAYATKVFFNPSKEVGESWDELMGKWQQCGIGVSMQDKIS
jgi:hypothetical protein